MLVNTDCMENEKESGENTGSATRSSHNASKKIYNHTKYDKHKQINTLYVRCKGIKHVKVDYQ